MKALFNDIADAVSVVRNRAAERREDEKHERAKARLRRKIELEEFEKQLRAEIAAEK